MAQPLSALRCAAILVGRCGYSVLNVDKLTYAASLQSLDAVPDHSNYWFVQLDIVNWKRMVELTEEFEPDAIVHLAAETHVDRAIDRAARVSNIGWL